MATEGGDFLVQAATYLGAAAIAVPIFNRFKLGSILGYLAAGIIVGPSGLNLLRQPEGVFHIAELGVVLFLFVIGLEISLSKLWVLRRYIFGLGAAQMGVTGVVIAALFVGSGVMPTSAAIIAGMALAFSSTALGLQYMRDRGELNSGYGTRAFPVLLFQDIAVVPLVAAIPFAAGVGAGGDLSGPGWIGAAKVVGVVAVLFVVGRFGLDRLLRLVASSGSQEAFAAAALFLVAGTALAVSWAGLSMALGAFFAGVMLAESKFRYQIETDIEPFRGLLLGLFFISIGMRLDLSLIAASWWAVVGGAIGLVALKMGLLFVITRAFRVRWQDALLTGAVLSQAGEFGFVVFSLGVEARLFTNAQVTLLSAIVTLSMVATPFVMMAARRLALRTAETHEGLEGPRHGEGHILLAGFGRMGQIISQVMGPAGLDVVAIDKNPTHIKNAERFGFKVYFGDASRLDVLMTAGAAKARAIILCMDDPSAVNQAAQALRAALPEALILTVAHDRMHEIALRRIGPDFIVRETLESSLLLARETLSRLKFPETLIDEFISEFRERDRERLMMQMDEGPDAGGQQLHQRFGSARDTSKDAAQ